MLRFGSRNACGPFAIATLLNRSYDGICQLIEDCGGDYQSVTPEILYKVLDILSGVKKVKVYKKRVLFRDWRKNKTGQWILNVAYFENQGHCIALDSTGRGRDNGWVGQWEVQDKIRVNVAYQLRDAASISIEEFYIKQQLSVSV